MVERAAYELVRVRDGAFSIRSVAYGETMHPGLGPVAEARALYVEQLRLVEHLLGHKGEFVIWDIGLGAAANILTVLSALQSLDLALRVISFDQTLDPLRFAFQHQAALGYFAGYQHAIERLLEAHGTEFECGRASVNWQVQVTDFPTLLERADADRLVKPHLVLFDPWSPAKNPAMWTARLFGRLHHLLDAVRPCVLPTYSRSTLLRVTLLMSGFWVGTGRAAGRKEETTLAANRPEWIERPLDGRWLERAGRSSSAEPLWEPIYRRAPLSNHSRHQLRQHPQFQRAAPPEPSEVRLRGSTL
jgi:tRNA U34 5-methylaminomethyl-2-thiouridine-forming methyltransferase MnmC